ncbi:MAG: MFS transporter [bacterium]
MSESRLQEDMPRLGVGRSLAYAAGMVPAAYGVQLITNWLMYYYYPGEGKGKMYMALGTYVVIQLIGRVVDSVADPLVGYISDRTRSRWGRRIPYIIFGTPVLAVTMALMWFPLTEGPSMANNIWLAVNLSVFWFAYTVVVAPHLSLLPEIAPENEERNRLGGWMALGEVLGYIIALVGFAILIETFKEGVSFGPISFSNGFKFVGVIAGVWILILFWLTWWFIKEKPAARSKEVPFNFFQAARETLKNPTYPPFLIMIALVRLLVDVVFVLVPYYTVATLELVEGDVAIFQGCMIIGSVFFFPVVIKLANIKGKKWVFNKGLLSFAIVLPLPVILPFLPIDSAGGLKIAGAIVFASFAPGAAVFLVFSRVVLTDIMDFDEKVTGYRREAMYNGIEGLITKLAAGMAPVIVALNFFLFSEGKGILTAFVMNALIGLIGYLVFKSYPIEK